MNAAAESPFGESPAPLWAQALMMAAPAAFMALGGLWISHPGLNYDETLFILGAYGEEPGGAALKTSLFGQPVSLLIMPYLGALKGWAYRGLLEALPAAPLSARLPMLLLGAATVGLLAALAWRLFGWKSALFAAWLAATDPVFLLSTRLDWGPVAIQRLCLLAGVWLALRWRELRCPGRLFGASACCALGIFDKLSFLWLLAGLSGAALLFYRQEIRHELRRGLVWAALAAAAAGLAPYAAHAVARPSEGVRFSLEREPGDAAFKGYVLRRCLEGNIFEGWLWRLRAENPAAPLGAAGLLAELSAGRRANRTLLLPLAAASLLLFPVWRKTPQARAILFWTAFCLLAWAAMMAIDDAGAAHHLTLVYPVPHLIVAAALAAAAQPLVRGRTVWRVRALFAAGVLAVLFNASSLALQYGQMLRNGGTPHWTEAVYRLHHFLRQRAPAQILALDWGMGTQLRFLSRYGLPVREAPQAHREEAAALQAINESLERPGTLFVMYAPEEAKVSPRTSELFFEAAVRGGREPVLEGVIRDFQGRPMYEAYSAGKGSAAPGLQ